ncbi:SDR family oxidoreductase [Patescibacteria group bacterium]|nr:SDR family oxidoreductase [Patescibacteria group bacterium]
MKKTVLITGSSRGIGRATAFRFADAGWNVIATMRHPEKERDLKKKANVFCTKLDVTNAGSVKRAISAGLKKFKQIDVVINNAGYGELGVFEATSDKNARAQMEVNYFGVLNVVREILPYFRKRRGGLVLNISSVAGRIAVPMFALYNASKWAVEGLSETLYSEVSGFGIKVKLIEPGGVSSDFFSDQSADYLVSGIKGYAKLEKSFKKNIQEAVKVGSTCEYVAEKIFEAASDDSEQFRYPVGKDARRFLFFRKLLPDAWFMKKLKKMLFK